MKKMMVAVAAAFCVKLSFAALRLGAPFADGAVLQRQMPVPVWGWDEPGTKVTVSFAGQEKSAVADSSGKWMVRLDPMEASNESRDLTVSAAASAIEQSEQPNNRTILHDILVGEVWYASGQSNMEMPLTGGNPRFRDRQGALVAQALNYDGIRFCYASDYKASEFPKATNSYPIAWKRMKHPNANTFSALASYYAIEIHNSIHVPVGIVGSYSGGTKIQPWTPAEGVATYPDYAWKPYDPSNTTWTTSSASVFWNEMVECWTPMAMRGFIWYQGCSNSGEWQVYDKLMHALYKGWSKKFENPDLKLYFVQLAPYGSEGYTKIRESQAKFAAEEPNAAMAVIADIGNIHDIHPNEKELVAKRLALHALRRDYGFAHVRDNSPTLRDWKIEGRKFVLDFNDAKNFYVYYPDIYSPDGNCTNLFEVCGTNGVWHPARILNPRTLYKNASGEKSNGLIREIAPGRLEVAADDVEEPKKLRFLYRKPWFGALYNEVNLPVGPFHIGQ